MKTISPALKAHLATGASTVAACWRITRPDGRVYTYTEHDKDITYQTEVYKATGGFNKTAIKSSGTFQIDNMEVTGFLTDDTIPDTELRNGAFDYSEVDVFLVNYEDLSMGSVNLRHGYFGEVATVPSGAFMVELRGLIDMLAKKIGDVYMPECRLDVGDSKCGIKLIPNTRRRNYAYKVGQRIKVPLAEPVGWIAPQVVENFTDEIDASMGFTSHCDYVTGNLNLEPLDGERYLEYRLGSTGTTLIQSRNINLLTETTLTATQIDSGNFTASIEFYATGREYGNATETRLTGVAANGVSTISQVDKDLGLLLVRKWTKYTLSLPLKAGTRFLKWGHSNHLLDEFSVARVSFDGVKVTIAQKDIEDVDYRVYGGVEFECITAGTTANTAPTMFVDTIGTEFTDGTAVWRCVQPKWMFTDTADADSTTSNHVKVTNIDVAEENFFTWGVIKFLTGTNAGFAVEILNYNNTTKILTTALPIPFKTLEGDIFQLQVGCDKRRKTCITKFDNMLQFRGHPDVPGQGQYFKVAGLQ